MPRDYMFTPSDCTYLLANAAALCSAAALLGGDAAEKRVKHLIDDACLGSPMANRLSREPDVLEDLLSLSPSRRRL